MSLAVLRVLGLLVAVPIFIHAAETNPPPRLIVELRDGSRVVGTSVENKIKFHSALLGDLKLAVKDIRTVECVSSNAAALSTGNGDTLTVSFAESELGVKTSFGRVALAADSLRRIHVSPVGTPEGLVLFWSGSGDGNGNFGTDPDTAPVLASAAMVKVANNASLVSMQQTRQLSYEAWIKPRSIPHEFPVLLSKGGNQPGSAYGGYEFYLNWNGDNDISFVSGRRGFSTLGAHGRWINQHLAEWIHVAFTLDDRAGAAKFYINGQPTNDEYADGSGDINFDVANDLYLGRPDPGSHPNRARFDGEMRDVKLFNRVLTAAEIRADFEAGRPD